MQALPHMEAGMDRHFEVACYLVVAHLKELLTTGEVYNFLLTTSSHQKENT
jgi:hypothetical protein